MKTIHISDELWKWLKMESVVRGQTMQEMLEGMGRAWLDGGRQEVRGVVNRAPMLAVKELTVELED